MAGFVTIFPILYIPVINRQVFRHTGISWEWGIVFVASLLFFLGVEAWKWAKRVYFRRAAKKSGGNGGGRQGSVDLESKVFERWLSMDSEKVTKI